MKTGIHLLPLLALVVLGVLLTACGDAEQAPADSATTTDGKIEADAAAKTARLAEASLIERFSGQMSAEPGSAPDADFIAASVNGRVRFIRETLPLEAGSASSTYLYFEDQPVYFHTRGEIPGEGSEDSSRILEAFVEFGVQGDVIGAEKRLDGERVPLADTELAQVMGRGLALLETSRAFQAPEFCDYNKTLRWNDVLATVSVPQGENCDSGRLRIFAQVGKRTLALDARREGTIADSWIGDFSGNRKAEIVVALILPGPAARGELLAFRADGDRLQPIEIAPLDSDQRAIHGGQDLFRVHGNQLIRRFPQRSPAEAGEPILPLLPRWERLAYDWQGQYWKEAATPRRRGWPAEMQGRWQLSGNGHSESVEIGDHVLTLEADGGITGKADCNHFSGGSLWFPGDVVRITPLAMTRMACPEDDQGTGEEKGQTDHPTGAFAELEDYWFAERVGEELRLTALEDARELRLLPAAKPSEPEAETDEAAR